MTKDMRVLPTRVADELGEDHELTKAAEKEHRELLAATRRVEALEAVVAEAKAMSRYNPRLKRVLEKAD